MRAVRNTIFLIIISFALSVHTGAAVKKTPDRGVPIVVFNPLSWTRTDAVEVDSPFPGESENVLVTAQDGTVCAGQNIADVLRFTARNVPPVGCKVFWASRTGKPVNIALKFSSTHLENQFFSVNIDKERGIISSIFDKTTGRNIVAPNDGAAILQIKNSASNGKPSISTWRDDPLGTGEVALMEHGVARARICMDREFGDSKFVHEVVLYDGVPRIDFRMTALMQKTASNLLLRVLFPANINGARATYGNQLGVADWCGSKNGVCGVRWLDLSASNYGISLLSNCKQGMDINGRTMQMMLSQPDFELQGDGMYGFNYSLYPHKGDWKTADTLKRSFEITYPFVATVLTQKTNVKFGSYISSSTKNVIFRIIKQPSDNGDLVVRCYEVCGKTSDVTIKTVLPIRYIQETDEAESPIGKKISVSGNMFTIRVRSHEIKTYKMLAE